MRRLRSFERLHEVELVPLRACVDRRFLVVLHQVRQGVKLTLTCSQTQKEH